MIPILPVEGRARAGRTRLAAALLGFVTWFIMSWTSVSLAGTFVAFGPEDHLRGTGQPVTVSRSFSVLNPNTDYTLHIDNGGKNGAFARVSSAVITVNGVPVVGPNDFNQTVQVIEKPVTLSTTNEVAVELRSKPGSGFTLQVIGVDNDPPTVDIASPDDGANLTTSPVNVIGSSTDALSGVAGVTCNGTPASLSNSAFSCDVSLTDGENPLVVEATDLAGNVGASSITVTFVSDTIPPSLTILSPVANTLVIESQPVINLSYSDDNSGVNITSLVFTANGNPLNVDCSLGATSGQCTPTTAFPEGPVTLVASLEDVAGNLTTTAVDFVVDSVPIEVSISSPADGLITKEAQIEVTGTAGANVTSVVVNGVVASGVGTFSATVPLREGTNMLVAVATKANGKTGTDSIEVTQDIVAPIVRFNSPRDGFVSANNLITVTGTVNDIVNGASEAFVTVNGVEATVANGTFMVTDIPLVRGPNTLAAVATDAVGNQGSHSITVTFQEPVGLRITAASGNGQAALVKQPLSTPLVAAVTDQFGNPAQGRFVRFAVSRNSGTLQITNADPPKREVQVPTDVNGRAAVLFSLGDTSGEGNNRVRATSLGVAGEVEFCASALAAAPDKILMVSGDNQRGLVGHPLPTPLEALVVDKDGNPIKDIPVTFAVVKGSGSLDGQQTLERTTGIDGVARAVLTLGQEPGINNNSVTATFPNLSRLPATFVASGLLPGDPADTSFRGVVLDNAQTPIPGAVVSIEDTALSAITDNEGQFLLVNVPVGRIELLIDPSDSPRPETFPPLEFETVTVAGQTNVLGQPILLPALQTDSSKIVGGSQDITLTMPGVAGLELTVLANSVTFPDGSSTGQLTISQVHLDKVPMTPPNGSLFMPPAWTIQPAGVLFDPPARISIPNDGLPPGRVIDIFQFDHTLNEFVNVGKGTVSEDGSVIVSDPGFGITRSGWGGCSLPPPPTTEAEHDPCIESAEEIRTRIKKGQRPLDRPPRIPFGRVQACIGESVCAEANRGGYAFGENDLAKKIVPQFINKFLEETPGWPLVLDIPPCSLGFSRDPTDLACAGLMATQHIASDLSATLVAEGCFRKSNWDKIFTESIEACVDSDLQLPGSTAAKAIVQGLRDGVRSICCAVRGDCVD